MIIIDMADIIPQDMIGVDHLVMNGTGCLARLYHRLWGQIHFGHKCPARRRAHEADPAFDKVI